jgi:hypothetical protein
VVVGVDAGLPIIQVRGRDPFGVASGVGVVQPFSTRLLSGPQARVGSLMSVRWVLVHPWTWFTWLWYAGASQPGLVHPRSLVEHDPLRIVFVVE